MTTQILNNNLIKHFYHILWQQINLRRYWHITPIAFKSMKKKYILTLSSFILGVKAVSWLRKFLSVFGRTWKFSCFLLWWVKTINCSIHFIYFCSFPCFNYFSKSSWALYTVPYRSALKKIPLGRTMVNNQYLEGNPRWSPPFSKIVSGCHIRDDARGKTNNGPVEPKCRNTSTLL